jgi:hypothetical protein
LVGSVARRTGRGYAPDYYAAFVVDPDGYRIEAYYGSAES